MAVTSGLFVPSFINILKNTIDADLSHATGIKVALIDNTATPDFDADDYLVDIIATPGSAPEVSGTNWANGGVSLGTPTLTVSPTGSLMFDAANVSQATTTLTDARAALIYDDLVTTPTADAILCLVDFEGDYSTVAGTFAITWDTLGIFAIDMTPA